MQLGLIETLHGRTEIKENRRKNAIREKRTKERKKADRLIIKKRTLEKSNNILKTKN